MVEAHDPERLKRLVAAAERVAAQRFSVYQQLAAVTIPTAK
jgi:hypothetical protein